MEAAVKGFSSSEASRLNSSSSPSDDTDVLMADAYLEYLNEILMTEEQEDCLPAEDDARASSYWALMKSFYDIIAEPLPVGPASSQHADSAGDSSGSSLWSEIDPIDSCDTICGVGTGAQTIRSFDNSIASNHSGSFEDQDKANHSGSFEHQDISSQHADSSGSSLSSEIDPINSLDSTCGIETGAHTMKSLNNLGSITSNHSARFEHQDRASSSGSFEHKDISFEDLNVQADYASLYVEMLSLSDTTSNESNANCKKGVRRKSSRAAHKGAQYVHNDSSVALGFIDLRDLLVNCAQAVALGDVIRANQILHDLYHVHGVSFEGNSLQRVAHYFCDALVARMTGTGWHRYQMMCENKPSVVSVLKASRVWYQMTPQRKMMHYFANQNILKAAEGAARLHILDFGISHGMQWPCLINALADRAEGPPLLVITGIENSATDKACLENLKATGRRLASYANRYRVLFKFNPLVLEKRDSIDPASLKLQHGEALVVNCVKYLSHLPDESVDPSLTISPRQKLLMHIRNLNPHLLLMADASSACGSQFFISRFREAVHYFYNNQDMLDTVCSDDPDRLWVEQRYHSSWILNIVACEGVERVERPETFKQWDLRFKSAGFELLAIPSDILSRAKLYIKQHYHGNFMLADERKGWLLMGWKGRILKAMSAWKPSYEVK